ncbi:hypothetical protein BCR41DRAFT_67425 [Lobosporangium transversale]|uniref:Uncharacterized protein n=1 Tax=Lobosporangium transversale TaxID=64571 RepID=A0A1Y2H0T1_9FUNG|nr:hypothetical protein BCR41DRAFT_67425 [Lobosporangium transversale]ORZ28135.1 hypothetical protein BCR41DRAFT_67425 [Lobosporangium transversale]|eukprot:XP_021885820.1 hypothetical protein BCR41DRAFT_67425 [Lobosporangium transversale]
MPVQSSSVEQDKAASLIKKGQLSLLIESSRGLSQKDTHRSPAQETNGHTLLQQRQLSQQSISKGSVTNASSSDFTPVPATRTSIDASSTLVPQERSLLSSAGFMSRSRRVSTKSSSGMDHNTSAEPVNKNKVHIEILQNKASSDVSPDQPSLQQSTQAQAISQVQSIPMRTQPEIQSSQSQQSQQPVPQKHKRRRSYIPNIPTSLITSNLARFVSGNHNASSPTGSSSTTGAGLSQANSPRSPRSPKIVSAGAHASTGTGFPISGGPAGTSSSSRITDQHQSKAGDDDRSSSASQQSQSILTDGAVLTIEQFKWCSISCCNEIRNRVAKQRIEFHKPSQMPSGSNPDVAMNPSTSSIVPPPQRKLEKPSKVSRFNSGLLQPLGSTQSVADTTPLKDDARGTLQALLQVMAMSTADDTSTSGQSRRDSAQDPLAGSATVAFYHGSSMAQPQNPSLLSLMNGSNNSTGGGSFQSLVPSAASTTNTNTAVGSPSQQQQNQQHIGSPALRRLRSKRSQSKLALAQANDAILNPLSLEELVRLLACTLSLAPEEWIPTHLYDFFVRPQGRKYRDLVELLPTQSQRILKYVLETVDALVDSAVMVTLTILQQYQQQQPEQIDASTPVPTKTKNTASSIVAAWSGVGSSSESSNQGSGSLRQQLSQVHLRAKNDVFGTSSNGSGNGSGNNNNIKAGSDANVVANLILALTTTTESTSSSLSTSAFLSPPPTSSAAIQPGIKCKLTDPYNYSEADLQEIAVRHRKRRAILDSFAGLVFRSRQDASTNYYGSEISLGRDAMILRHVSAALAEEVAAAQADEKGKSKRRHSSVASSTPTSAAGTTTMNARLQAAEREREAQLKAFENLMFAFEEEYNVHKKPLLTAATSKPHADGELATDANATGWTGMASNAAYTRALAMQSLSNTSPYSMTSGQPHLHTTSGFTALPPPPRQARSLTNAAASTAATDLATVRSSLSLPPWRKGSVNSNSSSLGNSHHPQHQNLHLHVPAIATASAGPQGQGQETEQKNTAEGSFLKKESSTATDIGVNTSTALSGERAKRLNSEPTRPRPELYTLLASSSNASNSAPVTQDFTHKQTSSSTSNLEGNKNEKEKGKPLNQSEDQEKDSNEPNKQQSPNQRRQRRMSATLSASWSTWKDHLLVLEEEELAVLEHSSDSEEDPALARARLLAKGSTPSTTTTSAAS